MRTAQANRPKNKRRSGDMVQAPLLFDVAVDYLGGDSVELDDDFVSI